MKLKCIHSLESYLANQISVPEEALTIDPELCPPNMKGDITINCYRLAKMLKMSPSKLSASISQFLKRHPEVNDLECVKAFVNITLESEALFRDTLAHPSDIDATTLVPPEKASKLLIEFSAPNTNKPQHLGHIRNNALGMALCSMCRRVGHKVIAVNLINDRGIHICKSMLAYQRFGQNSSPTSDGRKGDHMVGDFYVRFEKELQQQINDLKQKEPEFNDVPNEDLFLKTEIGNAAQKMLQAWEKDDLEVRALWKQLNEWVLAGFDQTYKRMGIKFDHTYFESNTYHTGKDYVLRENRGDKPIFSRNEDGSMQIDLSENGLGKKIVLRSDGTSVYVTQDIGTTILKYEDFQPDRMIWIVGNEQIHHFKVLFAILKKMGFPWADKLLHIPYGMVNLPTGKMKSREGTVVDADDLFDEMHDLAKKATLERCSADGGVPDDLEERARVISMGALKFMLLKVNPKTTISFDPSASIKFEGDTGPYIQYAYARIASILRKNDKDAPPSHPVDWSVLGKPEERVLALRCAMYPAFLLKASDAFDTSIVANYLLSLTKDFNRFYKHHSVLSPPTPELKHARIELCKAVQRIIRDGLQVLTIETLESM